MPDLIYISPEEIKEIRDRLGRISRRELANQLGVAKRTVDRWEQGHGDPNPSARKILKALSESS